MTPEKQRIAIAEACGWTDIERRDCGADKSDFDWSGRPISSDNPWNRLPNYLNDLNACAEFERNLQAFTELYYTVNLIYILCDDRFELITATATQRCEAFLRTISKWEDDK